MTTPSIRTARLELRPASAAALRAELQGRDMLVQALESDVPASWPPDLYDADAIRWTLGQVGDRDDGGSYGMYYIILRNPDGGRDTVVGVGGFKGAPNDRGEVELGYGIASEYQRRGYATEAVHGWVAHALSDPAVNTVVGQTLASLTASIGVLEKAGFRFDGAGDDDGVPDGETVVRYTIARGG